MRNTFLFRSFLRFFRPQSDARCPTALLTAEQLEPRILFSAAPVEAPDPTAVEEAPASAPVAAQESAPPVETAVAVEVPGEVAAADGSGEVSENAAVELVDVDEAAASLNQEVVEALAAEARQRWIDAGISAEQIAALDSVSYQIADVGGAHLGVATGTSITIDDDAGGTGVANWFIDATPGDDVEFGGGASAAIGRYDLLSTLIHEQGHVLGLGDLFGQRENVMDGLLDAGTRRLPVEGQAANAVLGSLSGDHFLTANIVRASTDSLGNEGNGESRNTSMSTDGRFVVFQSSANNLVANDTNGKIDVFVRDMNTGMVTRVSTTASGGQADGPVGSSAFDPVISADGRYVAFASGFSNLVADSNGTTDVFVKDLVTGDITRANTTATGGQSGFALGPSISADGRFVAFTSSSTNLVAAATTGFSNIFVKDMLTGEVRLASSDSQGVEGNGTGLDAGRAKISADGRFVAFHHKASNLVEGDTNGVADAFLKDLDTGEITRVSTNARGAQAQGAVAASSVTAVSSDGRYVVFSSGASNLVAADRNGVSDVFVKDVLTGAIQRVSTDSAGKEAKGSSFGGQMSGNGRFVAFYSDAPNLVSGDTNGAQGIDVFLKDLITGEVTRVNTDMLGTESGTGNVFSAAISADGRFVSFDSSASNLVAADGNGVSDVFVKEISSLTRASSTMVDVNMSGHLVINGSGLNDNLTISTIDGELYITDKRNTVGSPIIGSTAVDAKTVRVPLSAFTGNVIVRTLGGDDTVTIGDLSGLPGDIVVESGDGFDVTRQKGSVVMSGATGVDYKSDQVVLERGSSISTDAGDIDIFTTPSGSDARYTGIQVTGAALSSNTGTMFLNGTGGTKGGGNLGTLLKDTQVSNMGGNILIAGFGGGTANTSGNVGLILGRGTSIVNEGSGIVTLIGAGGNGKNGNRGLLIQSGVTVGTENGKLTVTGTGGLGRSDNVGLVIDKAQLSVSGSGFLGVTGQGQGAGSGNVGAIFKNSTISGGGIGDVEVAGASSATEGSGNRGMDLRSATISSVDGDLLIESEAGAGKNSNTGIRMRGAEVLNQNGNIDFSVVRTGATTGNGNGGIEISGSRIEAIGNVNLGGLAGGGKNSNFGLRVVSSQVISAATATLTGQGSGTTTGAGNEGISAKNTEFVASSVFFDGDAGDGTHRNNGLTLKGGAITTSGALIVLEGASGATSGANNYGVNVTGTDLTAAIGITVEATGGGGNHRNYGASLSSLTADAGIGNIDIVAQAMVGTTGRDNVGLKLNKAELSGHNVILVGDGGTGDHRNQGVIVSGGSLTATGVTLSVNGRAKSESGGSGNEGTVLNNTELQSAMHVTVMGTGGLGVNKNYGLKIDRISISATTGDITLQGTAKGLVTGSKNLGISGSRVVIDAGNDLMITGRGGGGVNGNDAVNFSRVMAMSGGELNVTGTATTNTSGKDNRGVYFQKSDLVSAGDATVDGFSGSGTNGNQGVRIVGGSVRSTGGALNIYGEALSSTSGKLNIGAFIFSRVDLNGGTIVIGADGGGGTGMNHGVFMDRNITAPSAIANGVAGGGADSEAEAGDFFNP